MPPPMRYPEKLLVRLPDGTRDRIEALQDAGEQLADTQRRVILAGLDAVEREKPARRRKPSGK